MLTLEGGTLRINQVGTGNVVLPQSLTITSESVIDVAQGRTILSGTIRGDARLVVKGSGEFEVDLDSAFFGGIVDLQGEWLIFHGTQFVPVDIHDGEADLDGSVGNVQTFAGGTLNIWDTLRTGQLKTLNLSVDTGAALALELNGTNAGGTLNGYDQIAVTGSVQLGGTLQLSIDSGFVPILGQQFFLIDNDGSDGIVGAFANAPNGATISTGGFTFAVSYDGDIETALPFGGNDLVLIAFPNVPELSPQLLETVGTVILLQRRGIRHRPANLS